MLILYKHPQVLSKNTKYSIVYTDAYVTPLMEFELRKKCVKVFFSLVFSDARNSIILLKVPILLPLFRSILTLPPSCAVVIKSGNLNFMEPSGPLQACNGTALPLPYELY
jgi:hypothetical protein